MHYYRKRMVRSGSQLFVSAQMSGLRPGAEAGKPDMHRLPEGNGAYRRAGLQKVRKAVREAGGRILRRLQKE